MPHKFKQPNEQQDHRIILPHVRGELEGKAEEDDARHEQFLASLAAKLPRAGEDREEAHLGVISDTPAMEPTYGRIESSPLPLQRALLSSATNRKCGPSTPVPLWKMHDSPFQDVIESAKPNSNSSKEMHLMPNGHPRASMSARKLAAFLWETQGAPKHLNRKGKEESDKNHTELGRSDLLYGDRESDRHAKGKEGLSQHVNSTANHRHHHQHHHEDKKRYSKHDKPRKESGKDAFRHSPVNSTPPQVEGDTGSTSFVKNSSIDEKKVGSGGEEGSTLSNELVKVLNQIWSLEEQHNVSTSMVDALRSDLKMTKARVQELKTEQSSYQEDMEMLVNKLASEKSMLQERTERAILAAIKPLKEDLEVERRSKSKLESKHKKLCREMSEARKTLAKTVQEFEREQKARELMEDVCDELAREIGEDKAKVEELKQQSAKYREEVEQERQMLQMAEVWREERVQMKLAEARLELEEKNTALDKLRGELEAFLRAKRSFDGGNNAIAGNNASGYDQVSPLGLHICDKESPMRQPSMEAAAAPCSLHGENEVSLPRGELDDDDSFDDDLHSIELNRRSVSGNHEDPMWVHGNGSHQRAMSHDKAGVRDSLLLSPSAHGAGTGKQGGVNKLIFNRVSSQLGTGSTGNCTTSEIQEAEIHSTSKAFDDGMKDWDLGEKPVAWSSEELTNLWQKNAEEGRGSSTTKKRGKNELAYSESLSGNSSKDQKVAASSVSSLNVHGNGAAASKPRVFEFSQNHKTEGDDRLPSLQPSATFPSSPTRQWDPSRSSPDPSMASRTHQPGKDRPPYFKETSLKARLLEAKLEGQQEKLRNSQVHEKPENSYSAM